MSEPAGLDAQSLRDMRAEAEDARNVAEATLRRHGNGNLPLNGRQLARYVVALSEHVSRLVGCVAEAERQRESAFDQRDNVFRQAMAERAALADARDALERIARWLEDRQDPPRYAAELAREVLGRLDQESGR